jgi:AcrR family transcriptional regulator
VADNQNMSTPPLEHPFEEKLGLRERKKLKTRRSIQEHALRLFHEHGYEATTVEQIAEAAEVSPSTFFRYFPTKEDTVLSDEYDPMMVEVLRAQPPELSPVAALRAGLHEIVGAMMAVDQQRLIERSRLVLEIPALRSRQMSQLRHTQTLLTDALAERTGRPVDTFEIQAFVAALLAVWEVTIVSWVTNEGEADLLELLDRGFDFLTNGCPL